jgi:hypothetical protein
MGINYDDAKYSGKFVYLPKIGERAEFDIDKIEEVQGEKERFNFHTMEEITFPDGTKAAREKDLGFHVEAKLKNGKILHIGNLGAFHAVFKAHRINDGEKIKVHHVARGEWKVERV